MTPLINTRTLLFFGINSKVNKQLIPLIIPEGTSFQTIWMLFPITPVITESKLATLLMVDMISGIKKIQIINGMRNKWQL